MLSFLGIKNSPDTGIENDNQKKSMEEIQKYRESYPTRLEITLKTNVPNFQNIKFQTTMLQKSTSISSFNNTNVFFNPTVQLHKNIIKDIPAGLPSEYLYTQFFEKSAFDSLITRTKQSIRGLLQGTSDFEELKSIIKQNINNTLWALFNENNILNINRTAYSIIDYEWNEEEFFNVNSSIFDKELRIQTELEEKKTATVFNYLNTLRNVMSFRGNITGFNTCYEDYKQRNNIGANTLNVFKQNAIEEIIKIISQNKKEKRKTPGGENDIQTKITNITGENNVVLFLKLVILVLFYSYDDAVNEKQKLDKITIDSGDYDDYDKFEIRILQKKYNQIILAYVNNLKIVLNDLKRVDNNYVDNSNKFLSKLNSLNSLNLEKLDFKYINFIFSKNLTGGDDIDDDDTIMNLEKKVRENLEKKELEKKIKENIKKSQTSYSEKAFKITVVLILFKGPSVSSFNRASFLCQAKKDRIKYNLSKLISPDAVGSYVPGVFTVPETKNVKSTTVKNKDSNNQENTKNKTIKKVSFE
jgi:hypothetical protein